MKFQKYEILYLTLFLVAIIGILFHNKNSTKSDLDMLNFKVIDNFISDEDAKTLIQLAEQNGFHRSTVNFPGKSDQTNSSHSDRTSYSSTPPFNHEVIQKLRQKTRQLLQIEDEKIESLQIVRYKVNEEYKAHFDASVNLPRKHTILIYLNTLDDPRNGGATEFPRISKIIRPKIGRAVYFCNLRKDGSINPLSLHAAQSIIGNGIVKYACNVWIRK